MEGEAGRDVVLESGELEDEEDPPACDQECLGMKMVTMLPWFKTQGTNREGDRDPERPPEPGRRSWSAASASGWTGPGVGPDDNNHRPGGTPVT